MLVGGASQVALLLELLVQDVSVLVEAAVDPPHLPRLTHPQLLAHQPDEALVMGHQDDSALQHTQHTSHKRHTHVTHKRHSHVTHTSLTRHTHVTLSSDPAAVATGA